MSSGFTPAFRAKFLSVYPYSPEAISSLEAKYNEKQPHIPDAPLIFALGDEDIDAVDCINSYAGGSWSDHKLHKKGERDKERDLINPFLPFWDSKTDNAVNPWCGDTGEFNEDGRLKINNVLRRYLPPSGDVWEAPIDDAMAVTEVIDVCLKVKHLFVWGLGSGDNPIWRYGPALCCLSGFGLEGFRYFASNIHDQGEWQAWATCSDEELNNDLTETRKTSGYPCGLLRVDAVAMLREMKKIPEANGDCKWMKALVALHIAKHARLHFEGANIFLIIAYDGRREVLKVESQHLGSTFASASKAMQLLSRDLCRALQLPYAAPESKKETVWTMLVHEVLSYFHPSTLATTRLLALHPEWLHAPRVAFQTSLRSVREEWIKCGLEVRNVAFANFRTRRIDKNVSCANHLAGILGWPIATTDVRDTDVKNWIFLCPEGFSSMEPARYIRSMFRNIKTFGETEGFDAMLNSAMICDAMRLRLAGTKIGATLDTREYPFICVFPESGEPHKTTNQGKTSLISCIAKIINPVLPVIGAPKTGSAPDNRTIVQTILNHGSVIADEFVMPDEKQHGIVLSKGNIQTLCTGAPVGLGLAHQNITGFRLRHCLFASSKMANFPPDMVSRTLPIIMDVFDPATMAIGNQLEAIETGLAHQIGSLSMLAWIEETGFLERLKTADLKEKIGSWRFTAHAAVARMFTTQDKIDAYVAAATKQCERQLQEAEDNGLKGDLGVRESFNPEFYFQDAAVMVFQHLQFLAKNEGLRPGEVLKSIVENQGARRFGQVMKEYGIREQVGITMFRKAITKAPFVRPGFRLTGTTEQVEISPGRVIPQLMLKLEELDAHGNVKTEPPAKDAVKKETDAPKPQQAVPPAAAPPPPAPAPASFAFVPPPPAPANWQ